MAESSRREVRFTFRVEGLSCEDVAAVKERLNHISTEVWKTEGDGMFAIYVQLAGQAACKAVKRALLACPPDARYTTIVHLATERDMDGLTVKPVICRFWQEVGGGLEFEVHVL